MKSLLKGVANHYNLDLSPKTKLTKINEGYMNNCFVLEDGDFKAILVIYNSNRYKSAKDIARLEEIYGMDLAPLPSRQPIVGAQDGRHLMRYQRKSGITNYIGLYNYLEGKTSPWDGYTRRHLFALGEMHRKLHEALKKQPPTKHIESWESYLKRDSKKLIDYFIKNSLAIDEKLGIKINVTKIPSTLAHYRLAGSNQPVHMDFVRGNVLFSNIKQKEKYEITGILDFEKMLLAPIEIDIARTLAFLLVDCRFSSDEKIVHYYLEKGYKYDKFNEFLIDEKALHNGNKKATGYRLAGLIYFWCRDLWKFLVSNPYEDLKANYHYNATVKRLIEQEVIKPV